MKKPYINTKQPLANIMQRSMETSEPKDGDSKFARRPVESDASDTTKAPPAMVQRSELLMFVSVHSHRAARAFNPNPAGL